MESSKTMITLEQWRELRASQGWGIIDAGGRHWAVLGECEDNGFLTDIIRLQEGARERHASWRNGQILVNYQDGAGWWVSHAFVGPTVRIVDC